jgi:steroid delta-isomerase-like uncharacterized protein
MSANPKTLIHRWFEEVWNQGREETIDELFARDAIAFGLGETEQPVHGPSEFKSFWRNLRTAIPDLTIAIQDTIVDGDKAVVRITIEGTHMGDGLGVPASGNRINLAGIVIVYFSNGQIVRGWNSWDQLGLLRQISAAPASSGKDRFLSRSAS